MAAVPAVAEAPTGEAPEGLAGAAVTAAVAGRIVPVVIPARGPMADRPIAAAPMVGRTAEGARLTQAREDSPVAPLGRRVRVARSRMASGILLEVLAAAEQPDRARAVLQVAVLRGRAEDSTMRARLLRMANGTPSVVGVANSPVDPPLGQA